MIYFCADDYGVSDESNSRIEDCLDGALNKISILPNGETDDFKKRLSDKGAILSLHVNLVEGCPISNPKEVPLLISDEGLFKYSFVGLFLLSFSNKRREIEKQIYKEIQAQIRSWRTVMGETCSISIDSHQHTHMIPYIFKTLLSVIRDEGVEVEYLRIPDEPISPYVLSPSLYFSYSPTGIVKQWLLKALALVNRGEIKKSKTHTAYFMGVMFSGRMSEPKIKKLLPRYLKLAEKNGKNIELGFHPGYLNDGEHLMRGSRKSFGDFYYSDMRKLEYETLINFKI